MENVLHFDVYRFHYETGDLVRMDADESQTPIRLRPQPCKLLKLLIDKYPQVATHDEIKQTIWPEVQVDYDGSIHYCIRQIRAALNDKASAPKFIETIPKRGYRWKIRTTDSSVPKSLSAKRTSKIIGGNENALRKRRLLALVIMSLVALLLFNYWMKDSNIPMDSKPRIAIMPMQPNEQHHSYFQNNIAFQLVEQLTNSRDLACEVIGPTTTASYLKMDIRDAVLKDKINFLINGKFSNTAADSRILIEIIQVSNGEHVWVKSFDATEDHSDLVAKVVKNIIHQAQMK